MHPRPRHALTLRPLGRRVEGQRYGLANGRGGVVAGAGMAEERTGEGTRKNLGPPVAVVVERLAKMQRACRASREEKKAAARRWLESVPGMNLAELRTSTSTKYWTVAMLHLGGYDLRTIAGTIGWSNVARAARALKHPAVRRIIELIRAEQVDRILRGEYGVQAAAKAAAPAVMEHVAELAGGVKDKATGARIGRAKRDSDALRGAELLLTVSGDKVERKAVLHAHLFEQMSDDELERLAGAGEWPERFRGVAGYLPGGE